MFITHPIHLCFSFSSVAGDVELRDLQLKPEALNALKLPIKVKAGFVGTLKAKVRVVRGEEKHVVSTVHL